MCLLKRRGWSGSSRRKKSTNLREGLYVRIRRSIRENMKDLSDVTD